MFSIKELFENFMAPWSSQNKFKVRTKKKNLPGVPLTVNRGAVSRIKNMTNKLSNINNQIQR